MNPYVAKAAALLAAIGTATAATPEPDAIHWAESDRLRAAAASFVAVSQAECGTRQSGMWLQLAAALAKSGNAPRAKEAAHKAEPLLSGAIDFVSFRPRVDAFTALVRLGDAADADMLATVDGPPNVRVRLQGKLGAAYAEARNLGGVERSIAAIEAKKQNGRI